MRAARIARLDILICNYLFRPATCIGADFVGDGYAGPTGPRSRLGWLYGLPHCASGRPPPLGGLLLAPGALAHVTASPSFVEIGATTRIVFETPNERAPRATTSLLLEAPPGIELGAADAPSGWTVEVADDTARFEGGRIEGESVTAFPLLVTARGAAGTVTFRAVQGYDDGESVKWQTTLTGAPGPRPRTRPPSSFGRALAAGAVGLAVVAGSLFALRRLRRRQAP